MIASMRHAVALGAVLAAALSAQRSRGARRPARSRTPRRASGTRRFVFLGQERGFFKEQGIELDIHWTDGGAETEQAVITGSFDVALATGLLASSAPMPRARRCVSPRLRDDRRPRSVLVRARGQPDQEPAGHRRQDRRLLRPGSSSNQIAAALVELSRKSAEIRLDGRRTGDPDAGDVGSDRHRLGRRAGTAGDGPGGQAR